MSLLARLLLLIVVAFLPAIAAQVYGEIELRRAREAEVHDQALRLGRESAAELERTIEGLRQLLVTLAELPVARDRADGVCSALFARLRQSYSGSVLIGAVDAGGTVYCNSTSAGRLANVADRDFFRRAMATADFSIGTVVESRIANQRQIHFAYPWRDDDGRIGGAVIAALDLGWLGRHLAQKFFPADTTLSVIDRDGTYLVHQPDAAEWVGRRAPDGAALFRSGRESVAEETGADGQRRIVAAVPVAFGPAPDLLVRVSLSRAVLFAEIERVTDNDVMVIASGLAAALLLAMVGARLFIRRPIRRLAAVAERWRDGQFAARVGPVERRSELGRLAATFDEMADALADRAAALREAEERLRLAGEATGLGTWEHDLVRGVRVWSDQLKRILGLPPMAQPGLELLVSMIHPEDREPSHQRYKAAFTAANGGHYENEFRIRRFDDNAERWIALKGQVFFDAAGQPLRALGICLDVTERRLAEEAMRRSAETLILAVESTDLALWEHDIEAGRMSWSDRTKTLFGLPLNAEPSYESYVARLHPDDRERIVRRQRAALGDVEGEGRYRQEHRILLPDGTERWIASQARVLFDAQRRPRRVIGGSLDITERKRAEEAMRRLNEALEERVAERTRALSAEMEQRQAAEAALRQAQKMQAIGQLAGGVAHDFNNLLTAVIGNLELLGRQAVTESQERLVRSAIRAAERGAQLTQRLLAFSRKQHLMPKPVDINRLVAGLSDMLARTLGGSVQVRMGLANAVWPAFVDPTQIELALLNLAINARDAMPEPGQLTITTRNAEVAVASDDLAPGDYVVIAVTDTGTGMPEEVLARAFEPFFTTKDVGKGTGLGLSQVYGVMTQLGGTVRLTSRVGAGTTAELYLPRSHVMPVEADETAAAAARGEGAVILVVDDDADVRDLAVAGLREAGYRVIEADGGAAALALLDGGQRIDLLIADFAMPGMNGRMLAAAAKQRVPGLRVLHISGYAEAGALTLEPGEALLAKPFRVAELAQAVAGALETAPGRGGTNVVPIGRARSS